MDPEEKHEATATKIWDILEKHVGAPSSWGENFIQICVRFLKSGKVMEYRFIGDLGFGGKVWVNNGEHPYVNCYQEDMSPERSKKIDAANTALKAIQGPAAGRMDPELEAIVDSLKSLYLSALVNLEATAKHDRTNGQRDQDRLARAHTLLSSLEKKYRLPHWDYLDHKF